MDYVSIELSQDFTGGSVDGNLPVSGGRRREFDPWSGRIPHASEQLGLCATPAEPVLKGPGSLESVLCKKSPQRGACAPP